ncbi:DUF1255 family protein [Candidatus Peregrinibacteria bacterium]|jgi:uncharacterized protein YaiE (UPF0345 family)|nr:DUF1255 family protein [Candidatus Peregrinibacteria bacterium]MBT4056125.1 DUF1255 family protein [Candidatus Peregrinibacteria bacterium]
MTNVPKGSGQDAGADQTKHFAYSVEAKGGKEYVALATDDFSDYPDQLKGDVEQRRDIEFFRENARKFIEAGGILQFPITARVHAISAENGWAQAEKLNLMSGLTNEEVRQVMGPDFSEDDAAALPERQWDNEYPNPKGTGSIRSVKGKIKLGETYRDVTYGEVDPGEYEFTIEGRGEEITILSGDLQIKAVSGEELDCYNKGKTFFVPKGQTIRLTATKGVSTYQCIYMG